MPCGKDRKGGQMRFADSGTEEHGKGKKDVVAVLSLHLHMGTCTDFPLHKKVGEQVDDDIV